jgi:hypothetical protein
MADPAHVDIVRRGEAAIHAWRDDQADRDAVLDLRGADLSETNLRRADLSHANLQGARLQQVNFFEADLSAVDLRDANLFGADLSWTILPFGADLSGAILAHATLRYTDLTEANLGHADLSSAVFVSTYLSRARFNGAIFGGTVFSECDLTLCTGLDTAQHYGPSTFGIETLQSALADADGAFSPEHRQFFLNAGVPASLLDGLREHPEQFYSCFLSFAADDEPFPSKLYDDLKVAGVRCWKFERNAVPGRNSWDNISNAIRTHNKVIVICSRRSLQRPAVLREIERALQEEDRRSLRQATDPTVESDVLIPVRLDDYVLRGWEHARKADIVSKAITVNFNGWDTDPDIYKRELHRLMAALHPGRWSEQS